jgi:hypothetical protein
MPTTRMSRRHTPRLIMCKSMRFGGKSQAAFLTVDIHPSDRNSRRVIGSEVARAVITPRGNTPWRSSLLLSGPVLDSLGRVCRDELVIPRRPTIVRTIFGVPCKARAESCSDRIAACKSDDPVASSLHAACLEAALKAPGDGGKRAARLAMLQKEALPVLGPRPRSSVPLLQFLP